MGSHSDAAPAQGHGPVDWSDDDKAQIAELFTRYPTKRAALLPLLWMAQEKWGWLSPDVLRRVAQTVEQPPSEVLAVASFYSMFKKQPTGKYLVQVCGTLSCALRGADRVVGLFEEKLGISCGGTTEDGLFTLMKVECLASCGSAPMAQINEDFYEQLDEARIDEIIAAFRAGTPLPTPRPEASEWHWTVQS